SLKGLLDAPAEVAPDCAFASPLDITKDSAGAHALAWREELGQADAGVRTAPAAKRAATAVFLPSLSVALDYGFQGRDVTFHTRNDYWVTSFVVSWSLFNGGQDGARRAAAGVEEKRARTARRDPAGRVALARRTAYHPGPVAL